MKRIVKLIILKVVEIAGAALIWWSLSWYGHWICMLIVSDYNPNCWGERWIIAPVFGFCIGIVAPIAVCFGIYKWIQWNWEKAGK